MKIMATAAAKLRQSFPTLRDPLDGSPQGFPVPGVFQARTLEWVAISFSKAWKWKVKVKLLSHVQRFVTPWTAAYQAPPSMRFSTQEYWSGSPVSSPKDHGIRSHYFRANRWGKKGNSDSFYFWGLQNHCGGDCSHEIKRHLLLGSKAMTNLDSILKSRHHFAIKVPSSQSYGFSSTHVWMWELDHQEGWLPKNWCYWTVVLEKTLETPLDSRDPTSQS